jgi:hypothetical protein
MTFRSARRITGPAMFACTIAGVFFGCSNKPPAAEAYVSAAIIDGNNSALLCGFTTDFTIVSVGKTILFPQQGQLPVSPTKDGDFSPGAGVAHVACTVNGSSPFNVQLSVSVDGMGSFSAFGKVDSSGNGTGIIASFTSVNNGTFRASNCTVSPMYMNGAVPIQGSPVSGGRIFAHIDCPSAINMGQSGIADDGGVAPKTCDGHADFLFENCD